VDPRRAPERVLAAQSANQIANLLRHDRSTRPAPSNFPGPEQTECFPVPSQYRSRLDEEETGSPVRPNGAEPNPQQTIGRCELGPLHGALQNPDLMAECEDLQLQGGVAPEGGENRGKECREEGTERESKKDRQFPIYQSDRNLRERHYRSLVDRRGKPWTTPTSRMPVNS